MKAKFPKFFPKISFLVIIFIFVECFSSKDPGSFDITTLHELQELQKIMFKNKSTLFSKSKDPLYITRVNFKKIFKFLDDTLSNRFYKLFDENKILLINYHNYQDTEGSCILVQLVNKSANNILYETWEELYLVYENDCNCVCKKKNLS